ASWLIVRCVAEVAGGGQDIGAGPWVAAVRRGPDRAARARRQLAEAGAIERRQLADDAAEQAEQSGERPRSGLKPDPRVMTVGVVVAAAVAADPAEEPRHGVGRIGAQAGEHGRDRG